MTVGTGEAVYWTATAIAGLMVVLAIASYALNVSEGEPVFPIVPVLLAVAIWLAGRLCRHTLTSR
jgi:hypothetical protein